MKALILDAHSVAALECVRSLGKRGMDVIAAGPPGFFSIASCSRYCARSLTYRSPSESVDRFILDFRKILEAERPDVTILSTDATILPVCRNRGVFRGLTRLALPEDDALGTASDKVATLELAIRLGIPVPETAFISSREDLSRALTSMGPPLVAKPGASRVIEDGRVSGRRVPVFIRDKDDCAAFYSSEESLVGYPILQEWRPGFGVGISGVFDRGRPCALFFHRRLREEHPQGGRSAYCESFEPDEGMKAYAMSLMSGLAWHGPAMVEFRVGDDGIARLMEINGRLWGSLPLAVASGVDVPWIIYRLALGEDISMSEKCYPGRRGRYLVADINHLMSVLKGKPAGWPGPYPARAGAVAGFIGAFFREATYFTWRRDDPAPGFRELMRFLPEVAGRVARRGLRR